LPAHDRVRCHECQVLAPAGREPASEDPQELVREAKAGTLSGASELVRTAELMTQKQVLEHEVLARAHPGQDGRQQPPEEFHHSLSIATRQPVRRFAVSHPVNQISAMLEHHVGRAQ
jgi:hypothetical protein